MEKFRQKIVSFIFLLAAFVNLSCENTVLMQNQDAANTTPTPIFSPGQRPSKDFLEHYHEGLKIRVNGKFPDDMPRAIKEFEKAAELDSKDTSAYWEIAELYVSLKQYDEAGEYYRKILERNPKDSRAQWSLAHLLVWDTKEYEKGLKESFIAKDMDASNYAVEETIGKAYEGLGDIPNAIKHYKIYLREFNSPDSTASKEMKAKISELEKSIKKSDIN